MTVAEGTHIDDQIDMEAWASVDDSLCVLSDFVVQDVIGFIGGRADRVFWTDTEAAAATHTFVMIDGGFVVLEFRCTVGTDLSTFTASDTQILIDMRFSGTVHFHFAGTGAAAHTDIFQSTAETGAFMALEMGECDEHVCVHNSPADFGFFYIFAAFHRYVDFIGAFQAVRDDHMASGGERREAVGVSTVHMFQGIFSGSHIQCVAVCEEGLSSQGFNHICHSFRIVGAQISQIARLAEMDFDGCEFAVEINGVYTCFSDQTLQFFQQVVSVFLHGGW